MLLNKFRINLIKKKNKKKEVVTSFMLMQQIQEHLPVPMQQV